MHIIVFQRLIHFRDVSIGDQLQVYSIVDQLQVYSLLHRAELHYWTRNNIFLNYVQVMRRG